jgi:hypothetical protein
MEKSSQITWKIVPLRHFFPLKVVPLIEVLLYSELLLSGTSNYLADVPLRRKSTLKISGICPAYGFPYFKRENPAYGPKRDKSR